MKKSLFTALFYLLTLGAVPALDVSISFATFKNEGGGYVEVYLNVVGKTATFVPVSPDSMVQASLDVLILFKQAGQIVKFDKYRLHSPKDKRPADFFDLKRFALSNGHYELEVQVEDANKTGNSGSYAATVTLDFVREKLGQSDIQLLSSFKTADETEAALPNVKSGYYFESLPFNFYNKNAGKLTFYNEVYNTDKAIGEDYMLTYSILPADKNNSKPLSIGHKRRACEEVCAFLQQVDISGLPSGNYQLLVEVRNRNKELMSQKTIAFQRANPYLNASQEALASASLDEEFVSKLTPDELRYGLKAIAMQVDQHDGDLINLLVSENKPEAMKLYLFSFWAKENPINPGYAYEAYMEIAKKIDLRYNSGFRFGFETDRGYTFLKYGAPNDITTIEDDPSAPPYEIWSYNQFPRTNQNNVKFLFYNPSLASNGFVLLHSNARGEVNNPRWEMELYRNSPMEGTDDNFIDGNTMQRNNGRRARQLMRDY
jgi:GWxTD domain-containing protein